MTPSILTRAFTGVLLALGFAVSGCSGGGDSARSAAPDGQGIPGPAPGEQLK